MTTETTDHPGGYAGAMEDFYRAAERIAAHLDAGRDVALLAEGDPLFYSSYMHMHTRLTERFDAVIVPGVTSVERASAATGTPSSRATRCCRSSRAPCPSTNSSAGSPTPTPPWC